MVARVALQREVIGPNRGLLLCGERERWERAGLDALVSRHAKLIRVRYLSSKSSPGALLGDGNVLGGIGAEHCAQYLVRPDGCIAFRCAGYELSAVEAYLARWFHRLPIG